MSNLAKKILETYSEEEKIHIKSWAESALVIRNDQSLTKTEKLKKLSNLPIKEAVQGFLSGLYKNIKRYGWDERSIPARGALIGLSPLAIVGTKWAGIAASGSAIAVPVVLLTSAGGALLGTIIKEINDSTKNNKR